jgi:hypothetical protein
MRRKPSLGLNDETAGLTFVWYRCSQCLRWQLFCWFPREDAAADYPCSQSGNKHRKLCLLHRGVLAGPTPPPLL